MKKAAAFAAVRESALRRSDIMEFLSWMANLASIRLSASSFVFFPLASSSSSSFLHLLHFWLSMILSSHVLPTSFTAAICARFLHFSSSFSFYFNSVCGSSSTHDVIINSDLHMCDKCRLTAQTNKQINKHKSET